MAYILKTGQTIEDFHGVIHNAAYMTIDDVIVCKRAKKAVLALRVFLSKDAANAGKLQLVDRTVEIEDPTIFDTYFAHAVINVDGSEFTKAYEYVNDQGIVDTNVWESDE